METAPSQDTGTSHPHLASLTTSRAERLAQLEEVSGNVDAPYDPSREQNAQGVVEPETKTLATSYAFWFPPLGLFGAHQYYLRNYFIAVFCSLTLGGVGVVWLVDLFRMKILVQRENDRIRTGIRARFLDDAYLLHIPWGVIGVHHYYMGNIKTAVAYTCTLSFCGIMWVLDMFVMSEWVDECNKENRVEGWPDDIEVLAIHTTLSPEPTPDHGPPPQYTMDDSLPPPSYYSVMQNAEQYLRPPPMPLSAEEAMQTEEYLNLTFPQRGETDDSGHLHVCYLDDAYLLHIPWGCIGLHQYYMGNIKTAVTYTCTLSFCGIMWVFDMFAMPAWVEECNEDCGDETSVANIEGLAIHTSLSPEPTPDHGPPPQYTMDDSLPPPSYYSVMQNAEQYLRPPPMPLSAEEAMQTEEYLNLTFPQRGETDDSGQSVFDII
ncbi:hypothetical protein CAPTEDRAFT_227755 [Capitella teleta]|uniref:TM2 domain-containing protein n=1 Tax=Capitella teleta TaxID=283909 RepID=R7UFK0_CAPTE|nr:hypothetical protein CAPTEDRAFT_227755 [Capitella teleta]|eukprot:ELU04878.1 hypothetical protein CAPTEDRAFT_227755 [Capitella teleta]